MYERVTGVAQMTSSTTGHRGFVMIIIRENKARRSFAAPRNRLRRAFQRKGSGGIVRVLGAGDAR